MNQVTQYWVKIAAAAVAGILLVLNYTNPPVLILPTELTAVLLGALVVTFGWGAYQGGQAVRYEEEVSNFLDAEAWPEK